MRDLIKKLDAMFLIIAYAEAGIYMTNGLEPETATP